ncbi:MAG: hypothetical protein BWY31_00188 [Lentisphaerae bacterium ADurb.Bin242]|nr:MAG: hypothetical protein BWY31_00188 [Lentisphaerae bacterium ADurb.Bin242]
MNIKRFYQGELGSLIQPGKVLALYGPRRAGKTTLLKDFLSSFPGKYFLGSGEDKSVRDVLSSEDVNLIRSSFSGYELVVIDEAQSIPNVGKGLKLLVDHLPEVKVIASGSSSFELANTIGEPLTGRKKTLTLYPVSAIEIASEFGNMVLRQRLEELLIYGSYPEVLTTVNFKDKAELLLELRDSYLFKDILSFEKVRNADKLHQLLTLLVFQVGKEVSLSELGSQLGLSKQTVERYLELLEKTFVIFRVSGFSRNLRSEVTKTKRYYFYDNGVMNAVINNFNLLHLRADVGALWENYLTSERLKKQTYHRFFSNNYFWRTYERQELDWLEERDGNLFAYEFKWGDKLPKAPKLWRENYPQSEYQVINQKNFTDFVL